MKSFRCATSLILALAGIATGEAAAPHLYVAAQAALYRADAGATGDFGPYVDQTIKSGTKSCIDLSIGADFLDWLSVEAGYLDMASFGSDVFVLRPDAQPIRAEARWNSYALSGFRLTPVFNFPLTERLRMRFFTGWLHSTGKVVQHDNTLPSYRDSHSLHDDSYNLGLGLTYRWRKQAEIEVRYTHSDFGKLSHTDNSITTEGCSLGFAWHF